MQGFREFINEATEEEKNIRDTLKKIPKSHRKLIAGYKFRWQSGNTLKGDDEHIGIINPKNKTVTIAAPWNYGREFTFLHELAHKVWEYVLDDGMRKKWQKIVNNTKNKMNQNAEELFCMAYANYYAKNKIVTHDHPQWKTFVEKLPS